MDEAWWLSEVKPNLKRWQAVYAAMVASVDEACRDLLQALQGRGLMENTIFMFTSDHGEMFGAHGRVAKNIFYEEAVRVPFLVYGPGLVRSGVRCEECFRGHRTLCRHCWERSECPSRGQSAEPISVVT